jgi:hypothetical protein
VDAVPQDNRQSAAAIRPDLRRHPDLYGRTAWLAVLEHRCRRHRAAIGWPCWDIDGNYVEGLCGPRVHAALPDTDQQQTSNGKQQQGAATGQADTAGRHRPDSRRQPSTRAASA